MVLVEMDKIGITQYDEYICGATGINEYMLLESQYRGYRVELGPERLELEIPIQP